MEYVWKLTLELFSENFQLAYEKHAPYPCTLHLLKLRPQFASPPQTTMLPLLQPKPKHKPPFPPLFRHSFSNTRYPASVSCLDPCMCFIGSPCTPLTAHLPIYDLQSYYCIMYLSFAKDFDFLPIENQIIYIPFDLLLFSEILIFVSLGVFQFNKINSISIWMFLNFANLSSIVVHHTLLPQKT